MIMSFLLLYYLFVCLSGSGATIDAQGLTYMPRSLLDYTTQPSPLLHTATTNILHNSRTPQRKVTLSFVIYLPI